MTEVLIEVAVKVLTAVLMGVISVVFAYVGKWAGQNRKLKTVAAAMKELERVVMGVVDDLQQTTVDAMKAAHKDGKLTKKEIEALGLLLVEKTGEQISAPAESVLAAAGVDVVAMIHTVAEAYIANIKRAEGSAAIVGETV